MMGDAARAVIGGHQCEYERRVAATGVGRPAAEDQPGSERDEQIDVDDWQPVERVPVPVERTEEARAVRRRQIHQNVQQHSDHRDGGEHSKRCVRSASVGSTGPAHPRPHDCCGQQSESDDAERSVRRTAMPSQVAGGPAGGGNDVDVGDVRSDDERGRRSASGAAERRAGERRGKQRVSDVIQAN